MTEGQSHPLKRVFSAGRVALLGSVAALGIAVFALGGSLAPRGATPWVQPAYAAEYAHAPAGFADLVEKVKPAVFAVKVKLEKPISGDPTAAVDPNSGGGPNKPRNDESRNDDKNGGSNRPDAAPDRDRPDNDRSDDDRPRTDVVKAEGSGFFISADGYAVTNNHVVDHAKTLQIETDDGTVYKARVIGVDPKTDLALIKVDSDQPFPFVKFADDRPRIGDWVVAVGNPFGLSGTVTAGIVSAQGRDIHSGPYDDYIQIDAPINHGNSGGPTFNVNGLVIGVNTAIYSPNQGSVGIGFDIPADTVKAIVSQLKENGHVTRAYLGVKVKPMTVEVAERLGLKKAQGAVIDRPEEGSPAAKAGLERGDVITAIDGNPVKDSRELARKIAIMAPASTIKLDIVHKGEIKTINVTLSAMPEA